MLSTLFGSQTARSSFLCFCLSLYSAACGEIQRHLERINGVIAVLSPNLQLHLHNTQAGTSKDFYPRPPRGGRRGFIYHCGLKKLFLSTPSARRATLGGFSGSVGISEFLSTPSARRATCGLTSGHCQASDFYPRPPRGGRRYGNPGSRICYGFLSTPSARRATRCQGERHRRRRNFYPRPPRGGRRTSWQTSLIAKDFYPRPPRGGRPVPGDVPRVYHVYFYPRPPRGGRHQYLLGNGVTLTFLSTPSARRATESEV